MEHPETTTILITGGVSGFGKGAAIELGNRFDPQIQIDDPVGVIAEETGRLRNACPEAIAPRIKVILEITRIVKGDAPTLLDPASR